MLLPDQIIDDRYRVESVINGGGVADVYRVRHVRLDSVHAMKVLHGTASASAQRALRQEGRIQAAIEHRNVVRVTDCFPLDGMPVLVMDYIDGPSLREWIGCRLPERRDPSLVVELFRDIVRGVYCAHRRGIVHRDLNPGNVFLTGARRPTPRVADFGLARVLRDDPEAEAQVRYSFVGTLGYTAPEQLDDPDTVDPRADLFSLGCILYEMVAQQPAFLGASPDEIRVRIRSGRYQPLSSIQADCPAPLVAVVDGLLRPDPAERVADCRALFEALEDR